MGKEAKTNAMRILDRKKIPYQHYSYPSDGEHVDGLTVAAAIGQPLERVYKTLVTVGKSGGHYVFVIPVAAELDLKKAAKAVGEKSVQMIHVKEINQLTGYIRGGCSPIGMKKKFPTYVHKTAGDFEKITVSSGARGAQLLLPTKALLAFVEAIVADLTEDI